MKVINISLLGHKDHGKSTLIGSMLMQTGAATKVRIKEAEAYSKKLGKSFEPAFILDSFAEERTGEMTIDTTRAQIVYKDLAFAFIDVPGHEELIKNMISGASYGEIALLMVSAKKEEGVKDQTMRHLYIARMLGIDRLVVAVNKMDTIEYDESKFEEIKKNLVGFIDRIGFEKEKVSFVPISAYKGENLTKKSSNFGWYKGKPLIDVLYENTKKEETKREGALRIISQGVIPSEDGELVVGKIVSGTVKLGERVDILPKGGTAIIKQIVVKGSKVKNANVGENVALKFDKNVDTEFRGSVISSSAEKPNITDTIKARIFVTGKIGKDLNIKLNGVDVKCTGIKILSSIDTTTGEEKKEGGAKILEAIRAEVKLDKKVPIEEYEKTRELGRFVLYSAGHFAGIGVVGS